MEWSLATREIEKDIVPLCKELGIVILAYSPLSRGLLSNTIKSSSDLADGDWRSHNPRFEGENF